MFLIWVYVFNYDYYCVYNCFIINFKFNFSFIGFYLGGK